MPRSSVRPRAISDGITLPSHVRPCATMTPLDPIAPVSTVPSTLFCARENVTSPGSPRVQFGGGAAGLNLAYRGADEDTRRTDPFFTTRRLCRSSDHRAIAVRSRRSRRADGRRLSRCGRSRPRRRAKLGHSAVGRRSGQTMTLRSLPASAGIARAAGMRASRMCLAETSDGGSPRTGSSLRAAPCFNSSQCRCARFAAPFG
jgi:hypothetical protein